MMDKVFTTGIHFAFLNFFLNIMLSWTIGRKTSSKTSLDYKKHLVAILV